MLEIPNNEVLEEIPVFHLTPEAVAREFPSSAEEGSLYHTTRAAALPSQTINKPPTFETTTLTAAMDII